MAFLRERLALPAAAFFVAFPAFAAGLGLLAAFTAGPPAFRADNVLASFPVVDVFVVADVFAADLPAGAFRAVAFFVVLDDCAEDFAIAFFAGAFLLDDFNGVLAIFLTGAFFFVADFFATGLRATVALLTADFFVAAFFAGFELEVFTVADFLFVVFAAADFFFALAVLFLLVFVVAMMSPRKGFSGTPSWRPRQYARQPKLALVCVAVSDDMVALDMR